MQPLIKKMRWRSSERFVKHINYRHWTYQIDSPTNCTPSQDIVLFSLWGNISATLQADSAVSRKYLRICRYVKLF